MHLDLFESFLLHNKIYKNFILPFYSFLNKTKKILIRANKADFLKEFIYY